MASSRAVFITLTVLMLGFGLVSSLLGVRGIEEFSATLVGLAGSVHYAGFLAGAVAVPRLVSSVGHIRVYGAIASSAAVMVLVFPFALNAPTWVAVRFVFGLCLSGMYIVAESWLNSIASNATRGRLLATYLVVVNTAVAGGQFLFSQTGSAGVLPFAVGSALISLSVVPLSLTKAPTPAIPPLVGRPPIAMVMRSTPLGPITSAVSGVGVSVSMGMGAAYGIAAGLTLQQIATLIAIGMLGGVVLQWPLGALSDRVPRRRVILGTAAAATVFALLGLAFDAGSPGSFTAFALFTALSFPLYSLGISHVNDVIDPDMQVAASGVITMAYGLGSVVGPIVAGVAFEQSPSAFWIVLASSTGVLVPYAAYRLLRIPRIPPRGTHRPLAPEPSTTLTSLWTEDEETGTQG